MRLIYADSGLKDNLGHHANYCREIVGEFRRRGFGIALLAYVGISEELKKELNAQPFFRAFTYWQNDGDPISGWLNCFDACWRTTTDDLRQIVGLTANDIVYFNSVQPAQFMGLVAWAKSMPIETRPQVVMEFGTDPGVDVTADGDRFQIGLRDYRFDPRAMFYRFAASKLTPTDLTRFHMVTWDRFISAIYTQLIDRPVGTLPYPQFSDGVPVSRVGRRPITVSVLGHQRPDKGFHLMPEIARLLLAYEADVRLLIHNGAPTEMAAVQRELRSHAAVDQRITLNEQTAGPGLWSSLLAQSDLVLCPYDPARFAASHSTVAIEALVSGIPFVGPAGTTLSRLLETYGAPGTAFRAYTPASIVEATRAAIADFDTMANRAFAASPRWKATMGVGNMVTELLRICGKP
jgi:hypothetical protein